MQPIDRGVRALEDAVGIEEVTLLVDRINQRHGTTFCLDGWFEGGEQGAHAIVDTAGNRAVLKWHVGSGYLDQYRKAATSTALLAGRGYPVPRYLYLDEVDGIAYTVQTQLPGKPMGTLDDALLPGLLRLNDLQSGAAPVLSLGWVGMLAYSVLHGFAEYCVIETLHRHSPATSILLDRLQDAARRLANLEVAAHDIVHFDFTPSNVLVQDGEISGVIDWDGVMAGDLAFDLATLSFYAADQPDLQDLLWQHGVERSRLDAMRLYLAHLVVRQVDWSIRFHTSHVADYWIAVSRDLADLYL